MSSTCLAIIGGSGLYGIEAFSQARSHKAQTPFGDPSSEIKEISINGMRTLFLARHGVNHTLTPSEVNYRANIFALKSLGATWCVSVSAVGSLQEQFKPGDIVIPDQILDRTRSRENTFFGEGLVTHVSLADPYCSVLSRILSEVSSEKVGQDSKVHFGGTYVCMEGPAFSSRAESNLYRSWQAAVIGMTALPEAKLAREAEISYSTLALVTDYDCWKSDEAAVDVKGVLSVLRRNSDLAKRIVLSLPERLSHLSPPEYVSKALDAAIITRFQDVPSETLDKLHPLIARVLDSNPQKILEPEAFNL